MQKKNKTKKNKKTKKKTTATDYLLLFRTVSRERRAVTGGWCHMTQFHINNWYMSIKILCSTHCVLTCIRVICALSQLHVLNCHVKSPHDFIFQQESSLSSAVGSGGRGYAYFKFEPFVLHVICRTLEDAQTMVWLLKSSIPQVLCLLPNFLDASSGEFRISQLWHFVWQKGKDYGGKAAGN